MSNTGTGPSVRKRIEDLRRELHEAELAEALDSTEAVMRNVVYSEGASKSTLGPTIVAQVKVNGVLTDVLVDTCSPVTIISLAFAMEVLATEKDRYSSTQEWKCETRKKFEPPQVMLKRVADWISWHSSLYVLHRVNTLLTQCTKQPSTRN